MSMAVSFCCAGFEYVRYGIFEGCVSHDVLARVTFEMLLSLARIVALRCLGDEMMRLC
jgi:hypothetical protein